MTAIEMGSLRQAVEETQRQLAQLVATVAELAAAVKVEDVRRQELERRVRELERDEDSRRTRSAATLDQRHIGAQLILLSATVSMLTSLCLLALTHIAWK